jgi:O-antigen/teichoic acid export membrane protein
VGQAIGQVYVGEAARLIRERPEALPGLFHRLVRRLLLVGAVPVVMVGLVAPPVFARVFGAEWHSAGVYVWWLTPMFVAQIVVSPISQSAALLERQGVQLVADALRTVAVFAAIGGAALLDWSDTAAVGAYSLCMLVTYVAYFEVYRRLLRSVAQRADTPGSRTRPVS